MGVNAELAKYFVGDANISIELLKPPSKESAYRDYDSQHAAFCAKEMETAGKNYPHKPAAVCGFEVSTQTIAFCFIGFSGRYSRTSKSKRFSTSYQGNIV